MGVPPSAVGVARLLPGAAAGAGPSTARRAPASQRHAREESAAAPTPRSRTDLDGGGAGAVDAQDQPDGAGSTRAALASRGGELTNLDGGGAGLAGVEAVEEAGDLGGLELAWWVGAGRQGRSRVGGSRVARPHDRRAARTSRAPPAAERPQRAAPTLVSDDGVAVAAAHGQQRGVRGHAKGGRDLGVGPQRLAEGHLAQVAAGRDVGEEQSRPWDDRGDGR